jgi:Icc protein
LSADPERRYRGQDADRNLAAVIEAARAWRPDLCLVTGDLSEDGSDASYGRLAAALKPLETPVFALPGNHDDVDTMRRHFSQSPGREPLCVELGQWRLILMNSSVAGKIDGYFDDEELARLRDLVSSGQARHTLVALHHQPVPVDAPWIDKYRLREADAFFGVLDSVPGVRALIWGHIHHEFAARRNGALLLGAPSTVANSLPRTPRFQLDERGAGCRWLLLNDDGGLETGILFADSHPDQRSSLAG